MSQNNLSSALVIKNALLASRLSKKIGNRLSAHGISLSEYLLMQYLDATPSKAVPRIELAEHLGMSASGVTRMIAPLEKNKLLQKEANPRDARQSLVKLSKTGQRVYSEARVSFDAANAELLVNLTPAQQEKFIDLINRIV